MCYLLFPRIAWDAGGHLAFPLPGQNHGVALSGVCVPEGLAEVLGLLEALHSQPPAEVPDLEGDLGVGL